MHLALPQDNSDGSDIYYNYLEGKRILAGENPYLRILNGDMRQNEKYPTYFPLIYLLSALTERLGLREYVPWLGLWRVIILAFSIGTGCLIYFMLWRRKGILAAVFGALLWYLSRWPLRSTSIATYDAIPIFFLLLSFCLLSRRRTTALLLFGLSLSLKHFGVLLAPLYLIWIWQATPRHRVRTLLWSCVLIASIPALVSIPFVVWPGNSLLVNAEALLRSLAFQVTRNADTHFLVAAPSLDQYLGLSGLPARLPMLAILILVYALFWRRSVGWFTACLLTVVTFIDLNPVLFYQYLTWMVPFVPLILLESEGRLPEAVSDSPELRPARPGP